MYRHTLILPCVASVLGSCVSYTADDVDPASIAAEVRQREGGQFTFEQALALAFRQNPELRAAAARARAAGADLEPFALQGEYRSGRKMLGVMVDPIALLDLGPRGAQNAVLDAEAAAAVVELAHARWRVAAGLAEVVAIELGLAELAVPVIAVDADAYERAGLASVVDAERVRAAKAMAAAERLALDTERERNRTRLLRLLGLPMTADVRIATPVIDPPVRDDAALLRRPDLALATARFGTADAEFRAAVAAQYPTLMIGPEFPLGTSAVEWMSVVRLPIGAWGRARAAHANREAARADLEAAFLDASRQARDLEVIVAETGARAQAAHAALLASAGRLAAALTAVEVDVDAFAMVAEAAGMTIRDTAARRQAELAHRRASNELDVAYGWPVTGAPAGGEEERP